MTILPLALVLAGCTSPVDPSRNGIRMEMVLHDVAVSDGQAHAGDLRFDHIQLSVRDVVFRGSQTAVTAGGPGPHDLVADGPLLLPALELETGDYRDVEAELVLGPTEGSNLQVAGELDGRAFRLASPDVLSLLAPRDGLWLEDGIDYVVRWHLQPREWFDDIDLDDIEDEGSDDEIRITPEVNRELYEVLVDRLASTTIAQFPGEPPPPLSTPVQDGDNPGTGTGQFLVDARISADDDGLEVSVDLQDATGAPLQGATVTVAGETLTEQVPGTYLGTASATLASYDLAVQHELGTFDAAIGGLDDPQLELGPQPVDVASPWTLTWTPAGASEVRIRTVDTDETVTDSGVYTIVEDLQYELAIVDEEELSFERERTLALTGALPGSSFEVRQDIRLAVDTTDSRRASILGETEVDFAGTLIILAVPNTLPASADPWYWWVESGNTGGGLTNWSIDDVEPGEWRIIAYLDQDGSDDGLPMPLGPDTGEPFDEADVTVDPGEDADVSTSLD